MGRPKAALLIGNTLTLVKPGRGAGHECDYPVPDYRLALREL
jgi:hypothetical protein